jgi:hypothetical protein
MATYLYRCAEHGSPQGSLPRGTAPSEYDCPHSDGVADNRRFHLVDASGRLFNGKHHGPLVRLVAEFDEAGRQLTIRFPDRAPVTGRTTELGEPVDTDFYGRAVPGTGSRARGRPLSRTSSAGR